MLGLKPDIKSELEKILTRKLFSHSKFTLAAKRIWFEEAVSVFLDEVARHLTARAGQVLLEHGKYCWSEKKIALEEPTKLNEVLEVLK